MCFFVQIYFIWTAKIHKILVFCNYFITYFLILTDIRHSLSYNLLIYNNISLIAFSSYWHKTDIELTYNRHKSVIFGSLMMFNVCYYCFTVPIKATSFEHIRSRCVTSLLIIQFSRELNSNMPCCISREVIWRLNSLENSEARRQLSMPELPSRAPSPYFAPLLCLLRIIASFIMPLTRELCQFYVGSMSVLCRFYVCLASILNFITN